MSDAEFIIGFPIVVLLVGFLWLKHRQRADERACALVEVGWHASGFDSSQIKPKVEEVRRHPLAGPKPQVGVDFHLAMLASMREAIAASAYFADKEPVP